MIISRQLNKPQLVLIVDDQEINRDVLGMILEDDYEIIYACNGREALEKMTGAEHLKFYMDGFIDLYHSHKDILRFNYDFNSFLRNEKGIPEQKQPYMKVVDELRKDFHVLYQKGMEDGTLNASISEETMFSSSFHIMLAAVTRYAIGLVYVLEQNTDPEIELVMLENLLLREFSRLN